ncbi:MAG: hypothetical protein KF699_14920 [Phycisphaeraceae bacterium]|nr:hypothetical protein [Fimbriimonadaceae bacterium]MBX3404701.1 hypothetical protein [Phycisphaeraceae bacterium]
MDRYGPLACFQVGQQQLVVDLRDLRSHGRFYAEAWGITFTALLVSRWRQWFGFERAPADRYKVCLRSVSVDTGATIFVSKPVSLSWSLVQVSGRETVGAIHEKYGLKEFDRRTGEVVGTRTECRNYDCVDPSGIALVQNGQRNVWLEHDDLRVPIDIKRMLQFLDSERSHMLPDPHRPTWAVDLGSKRPISMFHPTLARSMVLVKVETSIVGFAKDTGELVFTMPGMNVYDLAYHPERDTLIAMGWNDLHASLGSRILMEIDLDTQLVLWSKGISCVSSDRKKDPSGFLCDHGRYAVLPNRTILTVGTDITREVPRDVC